MGQVYMPYWMLVLKHFESHGYYYNGLTIPFLIGSRTILEPTQLLQSSSDLIGDICNGIYPVTLMKCENIGEYIIGLLDNETDAMRKRYPSLYIEFGSLIVTDKSFRSIDTLDTIAARLDREYCDVIKAGMYSKELGEWNCYTEVELNRLMDAKGSQRLL